ncbi:MAG: hypothetical protein MO852_17215, partial [Candidatus Devosia euplotis]|nr:hypothetical protein [Candidatus Devosia euplotis]
RWRRVVHGPLVAGEPGTATLVMFAPNAEAPLPSTAAAWVTAIDGDRVTLQLETGPFEIAEAALRAVIEAVIVPEDWTDDGSFDDANDDALSRLLRAAAPGDVVEVPPGTHRGRYVIDRPLTLRGACAEDVVLDPGTSGPALSIETSATVRIEEITFANARARSGAAIRTNVGADVRIACCLFRSNGAPGGRGGAIHAVHSRLEIVECAFAGNVARLGGAIAADDSLVRIQSSTFSDNIALRGGAVATSGRSELTLRSARILRSQASADGRDLYAYACGDAAPRVVLERTVLFRTPGVRGVAMMGASRLVLHDSAADRGLSRAYAVA